MIQRRIKRQKPIFLKCIFPNTVSFLRNVNNKSFLGLLLVHNGFYFKSLGPQLQNFDMRMIPQMFIIPGGKSSSQLGVVGCSGFDVISNCSIKVILLSLEWGYRFHFTFHNCSKKVAKRRQYWMETQFRTFNWWDETMSAVPAGFLTSCIIFTKQLKSIAHNSKNPLRTIESRQKMQICLRGHFSSTIYQTCQDLKLRNFGIVSAGR